MSGKADSTVVTSEVVSSDVFVIPDIHLKPWILEEAEKKISAGKYEYIVFLGDLVDEWG